MDGFGRVTNNNNRSLQQSIKGFRKHSVKFENREIRKFNASPEATKAYIIKVQEEAKKQRIRNIIHYGIIIFISALILYLYTLIKTIS